MWWSGETLAPDAPLVHEDRESNLAADVIQETGSWEKAVAEAMWWWRKRLLVNRVRVEHWKIVVCRQLDQNLKLLSVWATTQGPIPCAIALQISGSAENQVRLINPAIGGDLVQDMSSQMMMSSIPWIAMQLNDPWNGWKTDAKISWAHLGSDQLHYAEWLWKRRHDPGRQRRVYHNMAHTIPMVWRFLWTHKTHKVSNYRVPNFFTEIRWSSPSNGGDPVRGAGRPQGVFVMNV